MFPFTQDGAAAEVAYRQHRLAADYRRAGGAHPRRWHRSRRTERTRVA